MAKRSRDILKGWFETGDKPTQQQFYDWLDSFYHLDDDLGNDQIEELFALINQKLDIVQFNTFEQGQLVQYNGDATYAIGAASLLEKLIVFYGEAGTMKLSTVQQGDEDVMPSMDIAQGWNKPIDVSLVAENAVDLFINGIPAGSKIIFFIRKLKMIP